MSARIHDTGEAFLSAADKSFARAVDVPVHIQREGMPSLPPALVSAMLVALIVLTLVIASTV